jgi:hypothetical protein
LPVTSGHNEAKTVRKSTERLYRKQLKFSIKMGDFNCYNIATRYACSLILKPPFSVNGGFGFKSDGSAGRPPIMPFIITRIAGNRVVRTELTVGA